MEFRLDELLSAVRSRPQMFHLSGSYDGYVAFLTGVDLGNAGGVLRGFTEWLSVRWGHPTSLGWPALVRRIALGVGADEELPPTQSPEEERRAVEALFRLLEEYLEQRRSPLALARMYREYAALHGEA
ncbi:hypothetical protein [Actinoallomurus rhizosphaericola]|uniref:hypothetical protein n=1 Tax=Actinoallomurus rhizosphaericola TaxID=2952536 RepID=UPI002092BC14|nr:hypothetical protein [Actinoallomurus rhizosphaericola]MCO5996144.1 hypothetical protein [Actinoallomurus rhizosphaericola]